MANPGLIKNFTTGAVCNPYRIAKFGAADGEVLQGAAATDLLIGVFSIPGAAAASGERVDVILSDIADVEYGGTVTRGQKLTSDADGKAVAAAPAAGSNAHIIGYAAVSAVAGDIAPMLISVSVMQG